jgi:YVTN family beta-propeller protein
VLSTQAAGYVLRVPPETLDTRRFQALLERGRRELASGEAERASATLRDALALWRGPPLADLAFEPFAQTEIARLEELRLTALEARIEAELALGRHDSLVAELETLVAAHPYREGLRAQLMLALYRSGRQAEALETYRRARRTFSEELGIEPGPRLQALEAAILRHDSSLQVPGAEAAWAGDEERIETVPEQRLWIRWALGFAVALVVAIVAALVADARHSSGSPKPLVVQGDSVVVVDPATDTVVAEIPVGGRPVGPAVGEGAVWVGNRDDKTLLKIDTSSRDVVHIGLGVVPKDVEVDAGSVWVLSDEALLRFDAAVNDLVERVPLPQRPGLRWTHIEVGADAVYVCRCAPIPGTLLRIDAATSDMTTFPRPVGSIAYGGGALWALTGWESDRIDPIDPETNAVVDPIPLGRIGELHGYISRLAVGEGAIWAASQQSLWRIDPATRRLLGSVHLGQRAEGPLAAGAGAVWIMSFRDGALLRIDPETETVKTIPFGPLIHPLAPWDGIAVGDGFVWVAVTSYAS